MIYKILISNNIFGESYLGIIWVEKIIEWVNRYYQNLENHNSYNLDIILNFLNLRYY